MIHDVDSLLLFDLTEQTFISPTYSIKLSQFDLLAICARALQRRLEDLQRVHKRVLQARFNFAREFEKRYQETIRDYNFALDSLVLVRNSQIENELNRKVKSKYLDLMVVVRRTTGGTYILAELIDAISTLRYFAFRVISYHPRSRIKENIIELVQRTSRELDELARAHVEVEKDLPSTSSNSDQEDVDPPGSTFEEDFFDLENSLVERSFASLPYLDD